MLDIFYKQAYKNRTIQAFGHFARVAELVDAQDLKSCGSLLPCRFDSGPGHHLINNLQLLLKIMLR